MRLQHALLLACSAAAFLMVNAAATRSLKSPNPLPGNDQATESIDGEERMHKGFGWKKLGSFLRRGSTSRGENQEENLPAVLPDDHNFAAAPGADNNFVRLDHFIAAADADAARRADDTFVRLDHFIAAANAARRAEEYETRLRELFPDGVDVEDILKDPNLMSKFAKLRLEYNDVPQQKLLEFLRSRFPQQRLSEFL